MNAERRAREAAVNNVDMITDILSGTGQWRDDDYFDLGSRGSVGIDVVPLHVGRVHLRSSSVMDDEWLQSAAYFHAVSLLSPSSRAIPLPTTPEGWVHEAFDRHLPPHLDQPMASVSTGEEGAAVKVVKADEENDGDLDEGSEFECVRVGDGDLGNDLGDGVRVWTRRFAVLGALLPSRDEVEKAIEVEQAVKADKAVKVEEVEEAVKAEEVEEAVKAEGPSRRFRGSWGSWGAWQRPREYSSKQSRIMGVPSKARAIMGSPPSTSPRRPLRRPISSRAIKLISSRAIARRLGYSARPTPPLPSSQGRSRSSGFDLSPALRRTSVEAA